MYKLKIYLTIINKILGHCHSWLARQYVQFVILRSSFIQLRFTHTVSYFQPKKIGSYLKYFRYSKENKNRFQRKLKIAFAFNKIKCNVRISFESHGSVLTLSFIHLLMEKRELVALPDVL